MTTTSPTSPTDTARPGGGGDRAFRLRHAMYCNCDECNHDQPTTSEAEKKRLRSYLNGR